MQDEKAPATTAAAALPYKANETSPSASVQVVELPPFDEKATKKLLRKLDWHLIPYLSLIYLLCFLDRTNIGNARLDRLEQDLGLTRLQYNDCLAVLFPFYIAAEIPSNVMMKRVRPSVWLTCIMVAWSACMIGQGFVRDYAGLMTARGFLGLFEGGLFPGVNYYECGFRMALFFSAATLAGAFGGVLARAIAEMSGVGGLAAWSWIFILEGLLSILISFTAYWAIYDYPSTASFLSGPERAEVTRRLAADHGPLAEGFALRYVAQSLRDWKVYVFGLMGTAAFSAIYSFSLFLPTIVKAMGYSANTAQLMSVPPYVVACAATIGASWAADRLGRRGVFMLAAQAVAVAGFALLAASARAPVQYTGTVLAAVGIYPQIPLSLAWNAANVGGSLKRAVVIAIQVMAMNCGGVVASYVYLARDGPRYVQGHGILIGFVAMAFFLTLFMTTWCRQENARRDAVAAQQGAGASSREPPSEEQRQLERELADDAPWFRYTT